MARKTDDKIKKFINDEIKDNNTGWSGSRANNFGIKFQDIIKKYYNTHAESLSVKSVKQNQNPNDRHGDIIITKKDGTVIEYEVKSCKNGKLEGVTVCNTPELLSDRNAYLINYTIGESGLVEVLDVYDTQVFRLTAINRVGKYAGCLRANRDTGKKIKGRTLKNFLVKSEDDDDDLDEMRKLTRKTVLMYTASKFADDKYKFTDKEIIDAVNIYRKHIK